MKSQSDKIPIPNTGESLVITDVIAFSLLWFGVAFNTSLTFYMLPKTMEAISNDPRIIGMLMAINPLIGLVIQPLIGLLSDNISSPIGKRSLFIIIGSTLVAVLLLFIPKACYIWQLFLLVILLEIFHDFIVGSTHPLLPDLFAPQHRLQVNGIVMVAVQLGRIVLLYIGLGLIVRQFGEERLFQIGSISQFIFIILPVLFLKEKEIKKESRPKLSFSRYLKDFWLSTQVRRLAITHFWIGCIDNLIKTFMILYAANILNTSTSEFGERWFIQSLVALFMAVPISLVIERHIPKQKALVVAIVLEIVSCILCITADDANDLYLIAFFFGLGAIIKNTTFRPFASEFMPSDIMGQLMGAVNVFYSLGRLIVTFAAGWIVYQSGGNYRVLFIFAIITGLAAIYSVAKVSDERFENRKKSSLPIQ